MIRTTTDTVDALKRNAHDDTEITTHPEVMPVIILFSQTMLGQSYMSGDVGANKLDFHRCMNNPK